MVSQYGGEGRKNDTDSYGDMKGEDVPEPSVEVDVVGDQQLGDPGNQQAQSGSMQKGGDDIECFAKKSIPCIHFVFSENHRNAALPPIVEYREKWKKRQSNISASTRNVATIFWYVVYLMEFYQTHYE